MEQLAAQLRAVLSAMGDARERLVEAAQLDDDAQRNLAVLLHGTNDPTALQIVAELNTVHDDMARAFVTIDATKKIINDYIVHIGAITSAGPQRTSSPDRPAPTEIGPIGQGLTQDQIDRLRREIPPDIIAYEQRPRSTPQPKTHGRWISPDGEVRTSVSGRDEHYREAIEWFESQGRKVPSRASDVEMKLAVHMRRNGIRSTTLIINHIPCEGELGCDTVVPTILPRGYTLTVHGARGFRKTYKGEG
ncbi:MAG: hypothetical protein M3451_13705 [Chloroflexota bacterium]|nr:hypothetical protein [Chloroflexota bacterium]